MEKLDLAKKYKTYYSAASKPEIVDIGPAHYLSLTGSGDPSGEAFAANIATLYPVAYAIKFRCKARENDFTVAKLEGQWWFDMDAYPGLTMADAPARVPRSEWSYRLLIRLPDFVTEEDVAAGIAAASKKGVEKAKDVRLFSMHEGKSLQMLHKGPFSREGESLQVMHEYMVAQNLSHNGLHHEIYLSDFRKTAPEKLKTILREPVK
ncbi:GyrI-like domain-containing protein [Chitinophaga rhizosphaerae]|uniref:GyrI-like domain-containing protein n=1 Tax=Chitinophaga rhizosphaerae TaxID=1864947 RepID=UPI000F80F7DF|nr:GyrI-like domain-containing protein [Chitinophaga rhizosphaerae]